MKKGLVITAVVLTVLGLAIAAGAFALAGFDFGKLGGVQFQEAEYPFDADFTKIEIDTDETDVVFYPTEDPVGGVVCEERQKVRYTVTIEDGTLKIGVDDQRTWLDRLTLFSKTPTMTVCLPKAYYEALRIDGHTGDVSIPGGFTFGSIDVTSSTGDVRCEASADGLLQIKTATGDIELSEDLHAGEISLSVSTGRIEINGAACEGTVSVSVGTGKTYLTDVTCKNLISKGSTGDVVLKNTVASGQFDVERGTGDVRFENCDAKEIAVKTTTGDVTGTLRSEKIFLVKTSTGDVDVPETTSGGRCEITTATGDIEIRLIGD